MLAKLAKEIPVGEGWLYEPKWDGFRAVVFRDGGDLHIASRDTRTLNRYFPELEEPLLTHLPERCVMDGEILITTADGLDFDALLLRIHPAASRVQLLAAEHPATFVAFDLLSDGSADLTAAPLSERRRALAGLLPRMEPDSVPESRQVHVTPQTADPEEGQLWFEGLEALGLDGIIAKRAESIYSPGKRTMIKVKHQRTADCVVGGYRLNKTGDGIGSLLLGVYDGAGVLNYVGHTSSFKAAERRDLLARLKLIAGGQTDGFGAGRTPGGPSRWTGSQGSKWESVKPVLVCEVGYDFMQGDRFRHAATFLRWRTDKSPLECTSDQLG
jgi:ATP-dependent DNA ligase